MVGAKIKLNEQIIEKAKKYISEGHYANVVCDYIGIGTTAYYDYLKKGKQDQEDGKESIFTKFADAVKEAEAEAEIRHLKNILNTANEGTWQASAWYLERKHKNRWSTKQEIEYQGDNIIKVTITDD